MKSGEPTTQNSMNRKVALKTLGSLTLAPWLITAGVSARVPTRKPIHSFQAADLTWPFELPDLPYPADALDPVIDEQTMQIHHGKHHQGYTDKLNSALEDHPDLQSMPLGEMLADPESLPEEVRKDIRNNGGGYFNHRLFWPLMRSPQENENEPSGALSNAISQDFESFDNFREQFNEAATGVFGSGWAWLALNPDEGLQIVQVENQDTVLMQSLYPILGIDVWEHAYYLNYQNRRAEYVERFWEIVNWDQAEANYDKHV